MHIIVTAEELVVLEIYRRFVYPVELVLRLPRLLLLCMRWIIQRLKCGTLTETLALFPLESIDLIEVLVSIVIDLNL